MSLQGKDVMGRLIDGVVANIAKGQALGQIKLQEKRSISTQLALKHQQLMNMKMELVKSISTP